MATPTAFERLGVVRRRWWILLACVLVVPAAVYAFSSTRPKVYAAVLVAQGSSDGPSTPAGGYAIVNTGSARLAAGYVGTPAATQETVRLLADEHPLASVSASVDPETGWLT